MVYARVFAYMYYGLQFSVFMGFLIVQVSGSVILVPSLRVCFFFPFAGLSC